MSLRVFASAFILAYAAVASGQTAGWEQERRVVLDLRQQGRLHEALEAARKVLARAERHESGAVPFALALHDYAIIAGDLALFAESERSLTRGIRLLESAPTRDEEVIQIFRLRLGEVFLDEGRQQEAKALFRDLLELFEKTRPGSAELAITLDHLGWIEVTHRNFSAADSFLQRSIRVMDARTDVSPLRMGDILNDYASLLFSRKRYADAASYCERAQSLFNGQDTQPNATLINTWGLLAASYAYIGRAPEAEAYMRRAISASQSIYGEDNRRAGRLMAVGAVVLRRCGRNAEAKSLRKKADQILAKANREDPGRFTIDVNALR